MVKFSFNFKDIKPPTYGLILYILLIPFESILAFPTFITVSYATIVAFLTSVFILFYLSRQPKLLRPTKNVIPWLAFMIWSGFSIYWSINRSASIYNYIFIFKHIFFLLIISSYPFNSSEKRIIRHSLILSGILLSFYILLNTYQLGGLSQVVRATISNAYYRADPNHIASSLLIPIAFLISEYAEQKAIKLWEILASVVLFATLIITGSRGAFLAFLLMVLTFLVMYHHKPYSKKLINVIILTLAGIVLGIALYNPELFNRFAEIHDLDRYSANRITVWQESIKLWQEKPIQGYGFSTFPALPIELAELYKSAHNIFIQALVEGGAIGFILLLATVIPTLSFRTVDKFSRASKAGVVGIFTASMFLFTMNYDYFWMAIILCEISTRTQPRQVFKKTANQI